MSANNKIYAQIIGEAAQALAGYVTKEAWTWCQQENSTFIDCPVQKTAAAGYNQSFIVGVYNPSPLPRKYHVIAVPHGNWDVMVYNFTSSLL